jgi:TctA family transporter
MQENDYPVAPLILGMVIGTLLEKNFMQAMIAKQGDLTAFFGRPIAATLGIIAILIWVAPMISAMRTRRRARRAAIDATNSKTTGEAVE